MNFYSTYYKRQANYAQIQVLKDKFDALDANNDNALNKDELANIFTGQNLTQQEKNLLMGGVDQDEDGFLSYLEFIPTFIEFDIDQNTDISDGEYELVKKRIEELEKQIDINAQYDILNCPDSTQGEKNQARHNINIFNSERNIIYGEMNVQKKSVLISDKELKVQEIQDFIDNNTLLEFDKTKKLKEIENLNVEKNILLMEKNIVQKKIDLDVTNLLITNKEYKIKTETDPDLRLEIQKNLDVFAQQKISNQSKFDIAEKELEMHHKQAQVDEKESLLTKFFVPEPLKEVARKELALLYDKQLLSSYRIDLHDRISILSETRAELIEKIYQRDISEDPDEIQELQEQIDQLNAKEDLQQLEATISSNRVELIDKQIQLKAVMPKSNINPFNKLRVALEAEIADLLKEIADLESQLP